MNSDAVYINIEKGNCLSVQQVMDIKIQAIHKQNLLFRYKIILTCAFQVTLRIHIHIMCEHSMGAGG